MSARAIVSGVLAKAPILKPCAIVRHESSSPSILTGKPCPVFGGQQHELFAVVKKIIDAGGQFVSLAEPWADTSTSTGRLMIAVLGGLVDVERDLIRTRTGEGRARAKLRGQHMGRPPKMTAAQKEEARRRRKGEAVADLARSYGVSPAAIYRTTS